MTGEPQLEGNLSHCQRPDVIIEDNVNCFWCDRQLVCRSCASSVVSHLEMIGLHIPPAYSGLPAYGTQRDGTRFVPNTTAPTAPHGRPTTSGCSPAVHVRCISSTSAEPSEPSDR